MICLRIMRRHSNNTGRCWYVCALSILVRLVRNAHGWGKVGNGVHHYLEQTRQTVTFYWLLLTPNGRRIHAHACRRLSEAVSAQTSQSGVYLSVTNTIISFLTIAIIFVMAFTYGGGIVTTYSCYLFIVLSMFQPISTDHKRV